MAQVTRQSKQGANTEFAAEAAAGYKPLLSELDADLDATIAGVNDIDNTQVNAGAAIAYSKLNLAGGIVNADVNAAAAIARAKLATTGYATAAIATPFTANTTPATIVSVAITTTGGRVVFQGVAALSIAFPVGSTSATVTIKFKRDGTTQKSLVFVVTDGSSASQAFLVPFSSYMDSPAAGSYTYAVTAETTDLNVVVTNLAGTPGDIYAVELG